NYIALRCKTDGIYQYYVSFEPIVDCSSMRSKMVHQHKQVLGDTLAFDGMTLYLPKRLEKEVLLESMRHTDGVPIIISFKLVKIVEPYECIHLYNIIFKKIMRALNMCVIGRNYYMPSGAQKIPKEKLEVWPGYVTSCAEYQGGVMLLADVSHRVLRTQTAYELMEEIMCSHQQTCQDDISKLLVGNVVLTRYNNKCYRVDDINWNKTPRSTFSLYNGETLTFAEYYKRMYDITIQCMDQPLLLSAPKKKQIKQAEPGKDVEYICLVPELSYITGLTDTMRADNRVMRELASHTRLNPTQRRDALRTYCTRVNEVPEARRELERWGFELDRDLMQLEGRLLPIETIRFRGNASVSAGPEADWSRAVTKNETIVPVDLNDWLIFATKRDMRCAEAFMSMYRQCSRDMGIRVREGQLVELPNDRTESYMREIRKNVNQRTQLVVTIFPFQREDRYSAIKQLCCHDMPIPSQVINSRTISDDRKLRSVTQKIALQINCKLGGELWALNIPAKNLMVCGVDVTHDPAHHKSSVVGFVSNINQTCTRWYSKVRMQQPGEEIVNGLKICFTDALRKYYEVNHEFPSRVVIYRDGVGDGQLSVVRDYEVKQLIECFDSFKDLACKPKLGVIVVQKRINTRLLSLEPDNPRPGTVVDHTVTRNNWYDFFVVSQHIRQGTVSPTHYVVVYDGLDWKPDIVQALTYKMTHLYYNWPGTVRVPAPCQYAHKLAFLIGQNVRKMPDERLNDRLYYL
ncbi:hypothetical protein HELRODRAFT_65566, partial [Helobdella robusta]|uniref:Uncharacterized protein n=1 Tax=Helobdella robusta TaxID=6412 RepID=T1FY99_HELRO